jgi:hypothetical protein
MAWKDWFQLRGSKGGAQTLPTRPMDAFADHVMLELKTVTTLAITQALEARESNYMRSILDESYFLLESLVIKALDGQTIKDMTSFLSNHEAIDPGFRQKFFAQVLQREYRSKRGASVRVDPDLEPILEFSAESLDEKTDDESYVISLKGRKIRFEAQAVLQGPISKNIRQTSSAHSTSQSAPVGGNTIDRQPHLKHAHAPQLLHLTMHDRKGVSEQDVTLPVVLGRDGRRWGRDKGGLGIDIDATYVSRQQLVIFEVFGDVFFYIPASASLTCALESRVLKPNHLHALTKGQTVRLQGGIPVDSNDHPAGLNQYDDFPVFTFRLAESGHEHNDSTPRPRAVM